MTEWSSPWTRRSATSRFPAGPWTPGTLALLSLLFCATLSAQPGDPTIEIVNRSTLAIEFVYVSPASSTGWGRDWLGENVLRPNQQLRVAPPRGECMFDVRVIYSNKAEEERRNQNLCQLIELVFTGGTAGAPAAPAPEANADFEVVNRSGKIIGYLYVSPVKADNWGDDVLPGTISPGGRFMVRVPRNAECQYDVRVVYDDLAEEERRGQNLCRLAEIVFSGPGTRPQPSGGASPGTPGRAGGTAPSAPSLSFGTGFFISAQGHALTNNHVAGECRNIAALLEGQRVPAQLVRRDQLNDLALVRVQVPSAVPFVRFRAAPSIRAGESVVAAGYPLPNLLQNGLNVTVGNVSALAGLSNNTAMLQMTAPVQPGNSGGPLVDLGGNLVGVVVSKLDAMRIAQTTGDLPQNINFAVQSDVARLFVQAGGQRVEERQTTQELRVGDVSDQARAFTFQIECTE